MKHKKVSTILNYIEHFLVLPWAITGCVSISAFPSLVCIPIEITSSTTRQTTDCEFTLKLVRYMIITYSQMHRTDKYLQRSSIIWPVWLNGWVFVYVLIDCRCESRCCHINCRFGACFKQGVPWHSGNYRVLIQSETRT